MVFWNSNSTKDPETVNRNNADPSDDIPAIDATESEEKDKSTPVKQPMIRSAPLVIPHTYEQIIMYLDGRRSLRNMLSGTCSVYPTAAAAAAK